MIVNYTPQALEPVHVIDDSSRFLASVILICYMYSGAQIKLLLLVHNFILIFLFDILWQQKQQLKIIQL
jgi:hypothetical protein